MDDFYTLLGIHTTATAAEIKAAYHREARQWHPDTNPDPGAGARMQRLNAAWAVLRSSDLRAEYDAQCEARRSRDEERVARLHQQTWAPPAWAPPAWAPPAAAPPATAAAQTIPAPHRISTAERRTLRTGVVLLWVGTLFSLATKVLPPWYVVAIAAACLHIATTSNWFTKLTSRARAAAWVTLLLGTPILASAALLLVVVVAIVVAVVLSN